MQEQFSFLAGRWQGFTGTWFEPDVLADESPSQATFRLLLDGRFPSSAYTRHPTAACPRAGAPRFALSARMSLCIRPTTSRPTATRPKPWKRSTGAAGKASTINGRPRF
jgi:hypothetical protein